MLSLTLLVELVFIFVGRDTPHWVELIAITLRTLRILRTLREEEKKWSEETAEQVSRFLVEAW